MNGSKTCQMAKYQTLADCLSSTVIQHDGVINTGAVSLLVLSGFF